MSLATFSEEFLQVMKQLLKQCYAAAIFLLHGHVVIECVHYLWRQNEENLRLPARVTFLLVVFLSLETARSVYKVFIVEGGDKSARPHLLKLVLKFVADVFAGLRILSLFTSGALLNSGDVLLIKILMILFSVDGVCRSIYDIFMVSEVISLPPIVFFVKFDLTVHVQVVESFVRWWWLFIHSTLVHRWVTK